MPQPATEPLLTSGQAARLLGISKPTLLRAVRRGDIAPAARTLGRYARFRSADLDLYRGGASRVGESLVGSHGAPAIPAILCRGADERALRRRGVRRRGVDTGRRDRRCQPGRGRDLGAAGRGGARPAPRRAHGDDCRGGRGGAAAGRAPHGHGGADQAAGAGCRVPPDAARRRAALGPGRRRADPRLRRGRAPGRYELRRRHRP